MTATESDGAAEAATGQTPGVIPILDLADLVAGEPGAAVALGHQLRQALADVGFFFIVNHGIDWALVRRVYDAAAALHALPADHLDSIAMDGDHGGYLTYAGGTSYASEIAGEVRTPNLNAAFFVHRGGYRHGNRWPDLEGFQALVDTYMDATTDLGRRFLPVLAASLDLPAEFFDSDFDDPSVTLRLSHYPPVDYGEHDWGLAAHTDSSIFTFLPANDVPGLEIRPAGHEWITPPALPESFLVNSGDMLKRWTNNRFRSTAHRARNASGAKSNASGAKSNASGAKSNASGAKSNASGAKSNASGAKSNASGGHRYAIPFFFGARDDAVISAIATCVGPDEQPKHEPITYGDYQRWFLNRNYAKLTGREATEEAP